MIAEAMTAIYDKPTDGRSVTAPSIAQADSDTHLVSMWVARHSSPNTRRNYQRRANRFLAFVSRPLRLVRLGDVQAYLASLEAAAPATRANAVAILKSLLSFAQEIGYIAFNVGKVLKTPSVKNKLAERILSEPDVIRMISLEPSLRNRALLTVLYGGGLRISEVCRLCWRDLAERDGAGQATVFGKGGKTRVVLLSPNTWRLLSDIRGDAPSPAPVFKSRKGGGPLDESQAHRIVKAAAGRAGLSREVSAHWLRHAHASHSLERGAPIHLVQATLGHASVATTGRYLHARPSDSSARYLGV
jgi:integrase/recombinase XerD